MKTPAPRFLTIKIAIALLTFLPQLLITPHLQAGQSAVVITYQPIITATESTTVESPKSFLIMAVPYLSYSFQGKPAYAAVAHPHELLTNAPRDIRTPDANLISASGIRIAQPLDDNILYVRFEDLRAPQGLDVDPDTIIEATLECIRRIANENKDRPNLEITGKPGEEAKWEALQKAFADHDLSQPFKLPGA